MFRRSLVHAVVLAVALANCLVVRTTDGRDKTWYAAEGTRIGVGVGTASPALEPRLKGGGDLWGSGSVPAAVLDPILPTPDRSAAAIGTFQFVVRPFCYPPAGCRPPPPAL